MLGSMKISVKFPVMVRVDNVGAIFMASSITATSCTKHVDIRHIYVNEYVEHEVVKIIVVKSSEYDSDILRKNLSNDLHEKHSTKMVGENLEDSKLKGGALEMHFF